MTNELKKLILEKYYEHTKNSTTHGLYYHVLAKELDYDENEVIAECKFLEDDGCLEKEKMKFSTGNEHTIAIRITAKGIQELETTYNSDGLSKKIKKKMMKRN